MHTARVLRYSISASTIKIVLTFTKIPIYSYGLETWQANNKGVQRISCYFKNLRSYSYLSKFTYISEQLLTIAASIINHLIQKVHDGIIVWIEILMNYIICLNDNLTAFKNIESCLAIAI